MGQIGEAGEGKKVSGYFASAQGDGGGSTSPKKALESEVIVAPGRNSVPKEKGGSWFGELEKSATAEGKFIYRPQLSDLTNNVETVMVVEGKTETPRRNPFKVLPKKDKVEEMVVEGRTETPRRNPFKVVPKKDKVEEMVVKVKGGQEEEEKEEKVDSGIGSSQLSIYSIDAESLSFSQASVQV